MKRLSLALLMAHIILAAFTARAAPIVVFAAASLTDCMNEIAVDYQKETGEKVVFNFAASSVLARQISEGAPADIFFSADEAKMDGLEKQGLILKDTRRSRLSNSLVIVVPSDSPLQIRSSKDLVRADVKRIALADPQTVPAGIYSKAHLEKLKLWSAVEPKVIPMDNVRAALAAVESGNVDAGMVFKTDAAISKKTKIACEIPPEDSPDISYPMAVIKDSSQPDAAKKFLKYLDSVEAGRVFDKFGFITRK
jgi:molybdate transport system substrate-binding protein